MMSFKLITATELKRLKAKYYLTLLPTQELPQILPKKTASLNPHIYIGMLLLWLLYRQTLHRHLSHAV
jgi:hypothetical protein